MSAAGVARALESYHSVGLQLFKRPKRFRRADVLQQNFGKMILIMVLLVTIMVGMQHGEKWYKESEWRPYIESWTGIKLNLK